MKMKVNLSDESYWHERYGKLELRMAPPNNIIRAWIEKYVARGSGRCLEIGCFPGRFLAVFGQLGYELNGIDMIPGVEKDLPVWLKSNGFKIGNFRRIDFFAFQESEKYDIVCSFGFIEHYDNWQEVLMKHADLVKENGLLLIETPNFRGFIQKWFHYCLDRENYRRHHIAAMNPRSWRKILVAHGFEIVHCGYLGSINFWVGEQKHGFVATTILSLIFNVFLPIARRLPIPAGRKSYSSVCAVIARKVPS